MNPVHLQIRELFRTRLQELESNVRERKTNKRFIRDSLRSGRLPIGIEDYPDGYFVMNHCELDARGFGQKVRHLLLAYAFIRGKPYKMLEAKCTKRPVVSGIHWELGLLRAENSSQPSEEAIRDWLDGRTEPRVEVPYEERKTLMPRRLGNMVA